MAVPVLGHGKIVQTIEVEEKNTKGFAGDLFAGVYSNTASGLPGDLIAGGSATAASGCTKIEIPISPTKLLYHKTYWIMEQVYPHDHANVLYWAVDPGTLRKAYVQTHSGSSGDSSTSPWEEKRKGPYVRLR
ncbi:MAG TPA: hypothetical protein VKR31_10585 [Rhizomicrobium sp.]|nr:hypothetical protein [Rhizomicrobium sp.]